MISSRQVVLRYLFAKKNDGQQAREALRNVGIKLNNLSHSLNPKAMDYEEAERAIQKLSDEITKVLFGLHLPEAKKYITEEVLSSLNHSLALAKGKEDPEGVQYGVYVAYDRMRGAVELLATNPDDDEKMRQLSGLLSSLLPQGNTEERWYEEAIKLSKELAGTQTGKKQKFFVELSVGLKKALDGHLDLRQAAAFAFKMLPRVR